VANPPWGFVPANIFGDILQMGWETEEEVAGAWIEVTFPEPRPVREIWILAKPLPYDIVLDPYMRGGLMASPRRITLTLGDGAGRRAELRKANHFQILTLAQEQVTSSIRITIHDVWPEAGTCGTGLGKLRAFPRPHAEDFGVSVYAMYDVIEGAPVQAASIEVINPGPEVTDPHLEVWQGGKVVADVPLKTIPRQAVTNQDVWVPAPYEDQTFDFKMVAGRTRFQTSRRLHVPAYRSYFDSGTFNFLCTNHNDLGWLDTQEVTADYRSAELILPAMKLMKEFPEFRYSMESVAYLIEFLDRHPEKREEMAQLMREGRFTWGGSYVQVLEAHVGPEKLVRQFYLGRRWLKNSFPGADTRYYFKTDVPALTLQMPQILAKAGIKYIVQSRFPWGFYNWQGPDGSVVFMFSMRYADPRGLLNFKSNRGWLSYASAREYYYAPRQLPPIFIYDFNGDYLPPPEGLPPYVRAQNAAMKRFAAKWNEHYAAQPQRQIHPPQLRFVEPEAILGELSKYDLNIETLKGDWPLSWAYYDEPGNREGLLMGREGHNRLLTAERLHTVLGQVAGFENYPVKTLQEAWRANCWPDHGWGGNRGILTDANYVESYRQSRKLAEELLSGAGSRVARMVRVGSASQMRVVVFNPLSWARTDIVRFSFELPSGWSSFLLRDESGKQIPCQTVSGPRGRVEALFLAEGVPSLGYRTYCLEASALPAPAQHSLTGDTMENEHLRIQMGAGGMRSLYDKRLRVELLRTDKFFGGEVLQFTAPGLAWEDTERVTMEHFDKTSNHAFPVTGFTEGPVRTTMVRQAQFEHFSLRQYFHLYRNLDRVEMELDVLKWDGEKERELRVVFPINLDNPRLSYEVPFGTVEIGKDEVDFSLLPPSPDTQWKPNIYGADPPLPFREAINWIDASAGRYQSFGCLVASDSTVHLFRDQTPDAVSYPVLQHVLLATRKSLAWNPEYWFTQVGDHHYRTALYPHRGNWRLRYRDGIAFNYPLLAFVAPATSDGHLPATAEFLRLEPPNLILTAMKKCEDDDSVVVRFYEAEGHPAKARIKLFRPIKQAFKTNLIEEEPGSLAITSEGTVEFTVAPWEIVTLKFTV